MYFLSWPLTAGIKSMQSNFYRDYFLEMIDMMSDQNYTIPKYPNLSFGPGQRFASKGCYIVQIKGQDPFRFERITPWQTY